MNYYKIANRNVKRQKKKSNMLTFAIAFGTMVIILIQSLTSGLMINIENGITSSLGGHIYISGDELLESGKIVSRISDTEVLQKAIDDIDPELINNYHKRTNSQGTLIFHSQTSTGSIVGVDWKSEQDLINDLVILEGSIEGIDDPNSIILSEEAYEDLNLNIGDEIIYSFQTVSGQENVAYFTVIGVGQSNSLIGLSSNYVSIEALNKAVGLDEDEYQSLTLELNDGNNINMVQASLEESITAYGGTLPTPEEDDGDFMAMRMSMFSSDSEQEWEGTRFNITNLTDYTSAVLTIINIINVIAYVIFFIMLLITMIGLINTFRLIMNERVLEIGTMRAMGLQKKNVKKLFQLEGILIALKGVPYGLIAELVITRIVGLITLNPEQTALSLLLRNNKVYFPINIGFIIFVAILVTLISLFAVSRPVKAALKKSVAEELR
ncbi:MAG: ABC transporter permease [Pleomorphochaeta sp.]